MPVGVVAAYDNLMFNLDNLLSELKSSTQSNHEDVINFCELIVHLIDETASIYRDIKKAHEARSYHYETTFKDPTTEITSEISYRADSQYTVQSRTSMRSPCRLYKKSCSANINKSIAKFLAFHEITKASNVRKSNACPSYMVTN